MQYSFEDYVVDTLRFELRYRNEIISVEPRVFNLLMHFSANSGQLFSTDQLIETVWEGRIVSDSTIASCVKNARKALSGCTSANQVLETVRGRGFRFNADVIISDNSEPSAPQVSPKTAQSDLTLIVLPLRCLSDQSVLQQAVSGISNDLGSILNRVPLLSLSVEANRYHGREIQPTAREIHEELAVDFVLDGALQQIGDTVRINVKLANAKTGMQIWAETIENTLSDTEWQSHCVHSIIGRLEPQLLRAMHRQGMSVSCGDTAEQLYLEANMLLMRNGWNHVAIPEAQELLRRSCRLDPEFALAPSLNSMLLGFGNKIALLNKTEDLKLEAL